MDACIFCKMVAGTIPVKKIHDDDACVGIHDINAQAPVHALFFPKRHIATLNEIGVEDRELLGSLMLAATRYASESDIAESGFRLVMNCNKDAGQTVYHIHLHLLGGRTMAWPPG